jgi:hypothetical protein
MRYKPQIEDRLVEFGIEHLGESLDDDHPIVAGRKVTRQIPAHAPSPSQRRKT